MKILVATTKPFSKTAVNRIRDLVRDSGNEFFLLEKYESKDKLLEAVKDMNALIVRSDKVDKELIESAGNLKIIVRAGAGYDNIDLKAASEKDVVVMNTPGQNSNAVAELVFGMLLYMNRKRFQPLAGTELRGKKLGIHAYGYVGRIVGMIAKGFGMKVYAYDPFINKVYIENDGVKSVESAQELYSKCQYISLHIPLTEKTRESVNYELMNSMPEGATLVNTARKEVIHEESLLKMLRTRSDFRYLSDIAPDCDMDILPENREKVFFTPKKMGAQTAEANMNAGVAAANQIISYFNNGDTQYKVN